MRKDKKENMIYGSSDNSSSSIQRFVLPQQKTRHEHEHQRRRFRRCRCRCASSPIVIIFVGTFSLVTIIWSRLVQLNNELLLMTNNNNNNKEENLIKKMTDVAAAKSSTSSVFSSEEIYEMQPKVWRDWLLHYYDHHDDHSSYSSSSSSKKKSSKVIWIKHITAGGRQGRGYSMKMEFTSDNSNNNNNKNNNTATKTTTTTTTKTDDYNTQFTFFKTVYTDLNLIHAESHLREIKTYYLDRILGLNIALPCVGYTFNITKQLSFANQEEDQEEYLMKHQNSAILKKDYYDFINYHKYPNTKENERRFKKLYNNNNNKANNLTLSSPEIASGSMMIWLDGTEPMDVKKMLNAPFLDTSSSNIRDDDDGDNIDGNNNTIIYKQSAISYIVLNYLANCMKSPHNHFFNKPQNKFTAIDNDRCFTPSRISNVMNMKANNVSSRWGTEKWQYLINQICDYPPSIIQLVQELYNSNKSPSSARPKKKKISERLREALSKDVLANELLEIQPETFDEIDQRFDILAKRVKSCLGL